MAAPSRRVVGGDSETWKQHQGLINAVFKPDSAGRLIQNLGQVSGLVESGNIGEAERLLRLIQKQVAEYIPMEGEEAEARSLVGRVVASFTEELSELRGMAAAVAAGVVHPIDAGTPFDCDPETADMLIALRDSLLAPERALPKIQADGSFTTGTFFEFGHQLNVAASDDTRGKAIARYNELVPAEDRIVNAMSEDENVSYPCLMFCCLGDQVLAVMKARSEIDSKLGAAAKAFEYAALKSNHKQKEHGGTFRMLERLQMTLILHQEEREPIRQILRLMLRLWQKVKVFLDYQMSKKTEALRQVLFLNLEIA